MIGLVLVVFTFINKPDREALEKQRASEKQKSETLATTAPEKNIQVKNDTSLSIGQPKDSIRINALKSSFGPMAPAFEGRDSFFIIENDLMKARISSKGGYIDRVMLKKYKNWKKDSLVLFNPDSALLNITLPFGNQFLSLADLYFLPKGKLTSKLSGNDTLNIVFAANGSEGKTIEYTYKFKGNSYLIDVSLRYLSLKDYVNPNGTGTIAWKMQAPRQEKNIDIERNNTTIYYKYADDEVDNINPASDEKVKMDGRTKWFAFKQQFFTSAIISNESFDNSAEIQTKSATDDKHTKSFSAVFGSPLNPKCDVSFKLFFGPTHYSTLTESGFDLQKQIPLGWGIFGYVNKLIVIPVFNFLDDYDLNYGIVILLLTIVIKLILFPLQYRSYLSQAKMRVLKPEIDELNVQYEKEDPLKKQQAVMALYRKAGVNPLGGCVPLLFQMPILFAMFNFFPAAIELRQESFLWADDLSTFDSILTLPFNIPFYGNHVSLFALLMTASTIIYTRMNNQLSGSSNQMPGMKFMMYAMPVIFLFVLNSYAAGLNYYYFLANVITFGQQAAFRSLVDDKKIHAKIQENKRKPQAQKQSSFQKRLEEMAKKRGYQPPRRK